MSPYAPWDFGHGSSIITRLQCVISCPCHHHFYGLIPPHATASSQNGRDGDSEGTKTLPNIALMTCQQGSCEDPSPNGWRSSSKLST